MENANHPAFYPFISLIDLIGMDLNTLVNVLTATNNNDNTIRRNAEKALAEVRASSRRN